MGAVVHRARLLVEQCRAMRAIAVAIAAFWPVVMAAGVHVVDGTGKPVGGVEIRTVLLHEAETALSRMLPLRRSAITNADGVAPLRAPNAGRLHVVVDHPPFEPLSGILPAGPDAIIRLRDGRTWNGRIVAAHHDEGRLGEPRFAGGRVCATGYLTTGQDHDGYRWKRCGNVMDDGTFRVRGLPDGQVAVDAQVPGWLPLDTNVDPDRSEALGLQRGILLQGTVRDAHRRPVPGARCTTPDGARTEADAAGSFRVSVRSLPARLDIRSAGFRPWSREIETPDEIDVRLTPTEQIVGTFLFAGDDVPPAVDVRIGSSPSPGERRSVSRRVSIGEDGAFRIDLPGPGTWEIRFDVDGYRAFTPPPIHVADGQAYPMGPLALSRGSGVEGMVMDGRRGVPLDGVLVEVFPVGPLILQAAQEGRIFTDVSDEDGRFRVAGLGIGRYHVRMQWKGVATIHRLVDLERLEIENLGFLTMTRGVELKGRMLDRSGTPLPGVRVDLYDPGRELLEPFTGATTGADGRYRIEHVEPGRYRVEVRGGRPLMAQEVEVPRGDDPIELDLEVGEVRLSGWVTLEGVPVSAGTIRLTSSLDPGARRGKLTVRRGGAQLAYGLPESALTATVGEDGRFILPNVPAGLVSASYQGLSGLPVVRSLEIPDRAEVSVALELSGLPLAGRVVEQGSGVGVEATVRLLDDARRVIAQVRTDPQGWFRFTGLEPAACALSASADGYKPVVESVVVAADTPDQVLEMEPGTTGEIDVELTRNDGAGIEGVPVSVFDSEGFLVSSMPTVARGQRTFAGIAEADYHVAWLDPLAGAGVVFPVHAKPFGRASVAKVLGTGATVTLSCPRSICGGAVVEALGVMTDDGLELSPLLSGVTHALHLSAEGDVTIGRLSPGRYLFRLRAAGRTWEKETSTGTGPERVKLE